MNTFSKLSRIQSSALFELVGAFLSGFPSLVKEAESFIALLGGLIIPISSVICSNVKKRRLSEEDLIQLTKAETP